MKTTRDDRDGKPAVGAKKRKTAARPRMSAEDRERICRDLLAERERKAKMLEDMRGKAWTNNMKKEVFEAVKAVWSEKTLAEMREAYHWHKIPETPWKDGAHVE